MVEPLDTEALVATVREALRERQGTDQPWYTGEPEDALDTLASELERLRRACNICGKPWPTHVEECAYPNNVKDRLAAEAELERVRVERNYFQSRLPDFSASSQADFARAEGLQTRLDRAVEALREIKKATDWEQEHGGCYCRTCNAAMAAEIKEST